MKPIYLLIFGILYLIGQTIYWYIDYKWSKKPFIYTHCPKCEASYKRISDPHYECDNCGAFFTVDKNGQAHIPTFIKMFIGIAFGILWIIGAILAYIYFGKGKMDIIIISLLGSIGLLIIVPSIHSFIAFKLKNPGKNN